MRDVTPFLIALLVMATSAHAAHQVRSVPSGRNQRIDVLPRVTPDRTSISVPTVRLIDGPSNGAITTDKSTDLLPSCRSNVRSKCNASRVAGTKLFHQSTTEFFGHQKVRLFVIEAPGGEREAACLVWVK